MNKSAIIIIILLSLFACKKESKDEELPKLNYTKQTIQYKLLPQTNADLLSLDVYYDSDKLNESLPVIVWVHGGGWCIGDKANQMENKKDLFAKLGYILVSVNYRLSPFPFETNNPNRIMFPKHNIDVADAVKWVYNHIADYGGNPNKLALMGHSAGAHLVALTGTNHRFLQQAGVPISSIKGVAVIDIWLYDVYEHIQNLPPVDMYINAFGTDPQLNIDASPIRHIQTGVAYPKYFIVKRGTPDRIQDADDFISALQQANVDVSQLEGSVYSHTEINNAIGKQGETFVTNPLKSFFEICFQ